VLVAELSAALGAAALGHTQAMAQAGARKTFVLIHGAWHGGWCWRRVADLLEAKGHKVYAPSLTGNGDRSHLLSKDVILDTHITDIVNLFKWEDLKDVCLVAHSYGGWPSSGALEQIGDRVSSIIWLDAFKPENGQKGTDFASDFSRSGWRILFYRCRNRTCGSMCASATLEKPLHASALPPAAPESPATRATSAAAPR
jgi:pimeloyl-ACP methyl ester carboxylesterase